MRGSGEGIGGREGKGGRRGREGKGGRRGRCSKQTDEVREHYA